MPDSRKWFMAIAVVLLAAATANAQQSFTMPCSLTSNTELLRVGGLTEPVGELDLACNSSTLSPLGSFVTAQFTLQFNTVVTDAINASKQTMAGAIVQYNMAPFAVQSAVQGVVAAPIAPGVILFPNVVLPTGTVFTVRFVNVRVATTTLTNTTYSPAGFPQVVAAVSSNSYNPRSWSIGFNQIVSSAVVAQVAEDFTFAATDCAGAAGPTTIPLQECIDYQLPRLVTDANPISPDSGAPVYGVTFKELAPLSVGEFKNLVEEDGTTLPNVLAVAAANYLFDPPSPNPALDSPVAWGPNTTICDTAHEGTGDTSVMADAPPGIPACTANAWVSQGTRLVTTFTLADARLVGKIHIWVSQFNTNSKSGAFAILATTNSATGAGKPNYARSSFHVRCSKGNAGGGYWVELPDAATETAAWEVVRDNVSAQDDLTFAWALTYDEYSLPSLDAGSTFSPVTITGNIGPISTLAAAALLNSTAVPATDAAVVRFAHTPSPSPVNVVVDHCVTTLLFPYVTNVVGFETGIAISNTSLDTAWNLTDPPPAALTAAIGAGGVLANFGTAANPMPYNTTPQAGPCNLYLFGSASAVSMATTTPSMVQAIASSTTPSVSAGQLFADTLTTIFALNGGRSPVRMSGYVIARCGFQFGHGYAYLVDPSGRPEGYLALIIPDRDILNGDLSSPTGFTSTPIRIAQPFTNATFDEQGEMLAE